MLQYLKQFSKDQKKFLLLCLGFSFLITLDYSCLRPAIQSLFITHFGSKTLPWVWLASLPINFCVVSVFNRLQSRFGSKPLSQFFPLFVMALNVCLTQFTASHPGLCMIFYLWKDLYILLMFQQLWSQIHASMGKKTGQGFYGAMYILGALGSLVGASIPACLTLKTYQYLYCTAFIYPFIALIQSRLIQNPIHMPFEKADKPSATDGMKQIIKTPELITIGLLVAFMQMVSALSEFNFSFHLEQNYSDLSSRTQASAFVMSIMHACTLFLQFGILLLGFHKLGVKRGHKLIPLSLSFANAVYLAAPSFLTASVSYVSCKSLDFSLFSVLKESLYAPLDKAFKYQAKSFIDIFIYRGAKTITSLGLILFGFMHSSLFFGSLLLAMAILWFVIARQRLRFFETLPR